LFDWNDLRYFLAVAKAGSTLAAAKLLGTSQSTVHRRLAVLEASVGRPLVIRHQIGYRLTELGEHLLPYAEHVEEALISFERQSLAYDKELTGTVRVTCTASVSDRLLRSSFIDAFHARHPGLRVELVITDRILDLSKREADIAVRLGRPRDTSLVGRKIAEVPRAIYASRSYVERHGCPECTEELAHHSVVAYDGEIANNPAAQWLRSVAPDATIGARSDSIPGVVLALKSGSGLAPLPIHVGNRESDLVRLMNTSPALATQFWLLMHRDMRRMPRARAFFDFASAEIKRFRKILLEPVDQPPVEGETSMTDAQSMAAGALAQGRATSASDT